MIKEYLFIGGISDGQIKEVDDGFSYHQVVIYDDDPTPIDYIFPITTSFKTAIYRKSKVRSGDDTIEFFVLSEIDDSAVMKMLFAGYKPKQDVELVNRIKSLKLMLERCVSMFEICLKWIVDSKQAGNVWKFQFELLKFLNKK